MRTTEIFMNDKCDTMTLALQFVESKRTENTKEVKIAYNPQTSKFVAQVVNVTE